MTDFGTDKRFNFRGGDITMPVGVRGNYAFLKGKNLNYTHFKHSQVQV